MKPFYSLLLLISVLTLPTAMQAQVDIQPDITPEFFSADQEITLRYDVSSSSLSTLENAYLWTWLPNAGVDASSNINPASSNPAATDVARFNKIVNGSTVIFEITLTPTQFFNQNAENINAIGFLLKGDDWSNGQTNDYVAQISDGFAFNVNSPQNNFGFYSPEEVVRYEVSASSSASFTLSLDGQPIDTQDNISFYQYEHTVLADGQAHSLSLSIANGETVEVVEHSYIINPETQIASLPANARVGLNDNFPQNGELTLVLTAPNKGNVFVIGDFNNWQLSDEYLMYKDGDNFWLTISNLDPNQEYKFQYLVDGSIKIADPYAEKIGSPFDDNEIIAENRYPGLQAYPSQQTSEAITYHQMNKADFQWTDQNFVKPAKEDLVIYELLVRDFTEERTFQAVIDRLDYLDSLGINAIELMPIMEFEGNLSWGYNPFAMLAVDKYYGTENDFKALVDEAHNRGIAIILDIALNHQFGRNSLVRLYNEGDYGQPTAANPWFNISPKHDFNVGYDMNHESSYTQSYVDRVVTYWIEEYHVDGYRYDLSKGFTQKNTLGNVGAWGAYDATRVALLKRMADVQWQADPESYVILEHFADNSEETVLADYGMMLWGNENHDFRNLAKANNASVAELYYGNKGFNEANVIGYMESHDEERMAWDVANTSMTFQMQMQRLKMNAALFFLVPGPKMLWQFGEMGYDEELNNDRLGVKPTRWEYLEDEERLKLWNVYRSLIRLKTETGLVNDTDFLWKPTGSVKWLTIGGQDTEIVFLGNFSNNDLALDQLILSPGTWYDYFSGETYEISATDFSFPLAAGEFHVLTNNPDLDNFIPSSQSDALVLANDEPSLSTVRYYPNPVIDKLTLSTSATRYQLYNIQGKLIQVPAEREQNQLTIDMSALAQGFYYIKLQEGRESQLIKVLKN